MLYELRVYEIAQTRNQALVDRFVNTTLGFFKKYGIKPVLFLEPVIGVSNQLVYLVEWENLGQREKAWDAFSTDPEWLAIRAETEREKPILVRFTNTIFREQPEIMAKMKEMGF